MPSLEDNPAQTCPLPCLPCARDVTGKLVWVLFVEAVAKDIGEPSVSLKQTLMSDEPLKQEFRHCFYSLYRSPMILSNRVESTLAPVRVRCPLSK
jgi:hypothetical protein